MTDDLRVRINDEPDIVVARQRGRALASEIGFRGGDLALITTAISEIARNVIEYADHGELFARIVGDRTRRGIEIVVTDTGPGIMDLSKAMTDGYSTGGGLGLGLPGAKRLMDEFSVETAVGQGTTITMRKWVS
jgi:serine/threonine-protein kinase RsbT